MAQKMTLPESHNDTVERFKRQADERGYLHVKSDKFTFLEIGVVVIGVILLIMLVVGGAVRMFTN